MNRWLLLLFFLTGLTLSTEGSLSYRKLMGEGTPHWQHLRDPKDWSLLEKMELLYEKNQNATSLETPFKIPPIFHLIWLGPRPFPATSVENLRSWIAKHPGWRFQFWSDRPRELPCEGLHLQLVQNFQFSILGKAFEKSENWAEKSDLLRYEILGQQGGLYIDHDTFCLKSFESLLRGFDFFCCLEVPHETFVNRNLTCWNGLIGSCPGHPTLKKTMELIQLRWDAIEQRWKSRDAYSQTEIVMQRTYIAFTDALEETLDLLGNTDIVFPAAYFFAKSGIPSLYSEHLCNTTWDTYKERRSSLEKWTEKALKKIGHQGYRSFYILCIILSMTALCSGAALWRLYRQ